MKKREKLPKIYSSKPKSGMFFDSFPCPSAGSCKAMGISIHWLDQYPYLISILMVTCSEIWK